MSFDVRMGQDGISRVTLSGDLDSMVTEQPAPGDGTFCECLDTGTATETDSISSSSMDGYLPSPAQVSDFSASGSTHREDGLHPPPRHARVLAQFIQKASGRDTIVPFDQENDALKWLQNHQG